MCVHVTTQNVRVSCRFHTSFLWCCNILWSFVGNSHQYHYSGQLLLLGIHGISEKQGIVTNNGQTTIFMYMHGVMSVTQPYVYIFSQRPLRTCHPLKERMTTTPPRWKKSTELPKSNFGLVKATFEYNYLHHCTYSSLLLLPLYVLDSVLCLFANHTDSVIYYLFEFVHCNVVLC